jgi:endo-1,4-beta-xylanase
MMYLEPVQDHFDFTVADQVAAFAQTYGKTIRGHALIWNQEYPWWLAHPLLPWTPRQLTGILRTYISTVVGHFARVFPGVVTEWDVINEPFNWNGTYRWNPWEQTLGPSYIADALEDAHAADPAARLVINELGAEAPGPKSRALLALAASLKAAGVPLNAVGFEAHVSPDTAPSLGQLVSLWRQYAKLGLDVEVTELDVSNDTDGIDDPAAKVAIFERYAEACRLAGNCTGFTVWGVADQYSWLGADSDALLYNDLFQPSPAVAVIHRLLAATPAAAARDAATQPRHQPARCVRPWTTGQRAVRLRGRCRLTKDRIKE